MLADLSFLRNSQSHLPASSGSLSPIAMPTKGSSVGPAKPSHSKVTMVHLASTYSKDTGGSGLPAKQHPALVGVGALPSVVYTAGR